MKEETHKKLNIISTLLIAFSLLCIGLFVSIMIFLRSHLGLSLIAFLLFGFGLLGFLIGICLVLFNQISSLYSSHRKELILLTIIEILTIISTIIFRFSWFILITLLILNFSICILTFSYSQKIALPIAEKREDNPLTWKRMLLVFLAGLFFLYLSIYSPLKYYGIITVYLVSLTFSFIFFNEYNEFDKKISKLQKDKQMKKRREIKYNELLFLTMIPIIIDLNFSILYVAVLIHFLVVGLYITGYLGYLYISEKRKVVH